MCRKWLGVLAGIVLVFAAGMACGEPSGMVPREVPVEEDIFTGTAGLDPVQRVLSVLRKALRAQSGISGPTNCVTGETYNWSFTDASSTADTNQYRFEMTVMDGTYADPNMADVQYIHVKSHERTLEYTFYLPGKYVIFLDVYEDGSDEVLDSYYLRITVEDGGENALTRAVAAAVAEVEEEAEPEDDFEWVLALHDWVLDHCTYDFSYTWYSGEALFLRGTGVCNTYTRAMKLLLDAVGIPCRRVAGKGNGGGHAWNTLEIGGDWYLVDATWDDGGSDAFGRHRYFAVNSALMGIDHTAEHYSDGTAWPECTSLDANWFVHGDKWRDYAGTMLADYTEKMGAGRHRFVLDAPVYLTGNYNVKMLGTVTAYAMSRTEWSYGEGKTYTGTFAYDNETGKISGAHDFSGTLELPSGLTRIEEDSFAGNPANRVVIGDSCGYIGPGAFAGMDIWELVCGAAETEIDPDAFDDLDYVYVITSPNSDMAAYAETRGWDVGRE